MKERIREYQNDILSFDRKNEGLRVGQRIKKVRLARGLTQFELGEKVGLSADRIQKYETGYRKPKDDLLIKIANVLNVEAAALADPVVNSGKGSIYALYEIDRETPFEMAYREGKICLEFDSSNALFDELMEWIEIANKVKKDYKLAQKDEEKERILDEYELWKFSAPSSLFGDNFIKELELQRKISVLQDELANLKRIDNN